MTNTHITIGGHKVSAGKVYSTSEIKTGDVWIDGKPIYRKCYYADSISYTVGESGYVVGDMPNDIGVVVRYGGCCRDGLGGAWLSIPYSINVWNGSSIVVRRSINPYIDVNNSSVRLDIASTTAGIFYEVVLILEYTKTTD